MQLRCSACGAPATESARSVTYESKDGMVLGSLGVAVKYGCPAHPIYFVKTYREDGLLLSEDATVEGEPRLNGDR